VRPNSIPPIASPAAAVSEDGGLLQRARDYQKAGDLKSAEAAYLRLLQRNIHPEVAAQQLGKLYFRAGDYRRAEEMYRASARALRDRNTSSPEPLVP
jgi:tetratricopeptide (TPR) repeat protein